MGREFELKYRADAPALAALRRDYPALSPIAMETTYYDTPSGTFGAMRWTLRRRMENGVSVCTLKTPLHDGGRGEWEAECPDILEAAPLLIAAGAPEALTGWMAEGLVPTCGARFTRLACPVETGSCKVELALDSGVLLGGGKELPFAEVEVELKEGTDEAAVAFAETLARIYGLTVEKKSKFRRARDLAQDL